VARIPRETTHWSEQMIRSGAEHLTSINDGRGVYIDGEGVTEVATHPMFQPHRLTFKLFAQSPLFVHLGAVHRNFDVDGPLQFVRESAGRSESVLARVEGRA